MGGLHRINRSALPKARALALAECGTHAFLAAEVGGYSVERNQDHVTLGVSLFEPVLILVDPVARRRPAWWSLVRAG